MAVRGISEKWCVVRKWQGQLNGACDDLGFSKFPCLTYIFVEDQQNMSMEEAERWEKTKESKEFVPTSSTNAPVCFIVPLSLVCEFVMEPINSKSSRNKEKQTLN